MTLAQLRHFTEHTILNIWLSMTGMRKTQRTCCGVQSRCSATAGQSNRTCLAVFSARAGGDVYLRPSVSPGDGAKLFQDMQKIVEAGGDRQCVMTTQCLQVGVRFYCFRFSAAINLLAQATRARARLRWGFTINSQRRPVLRLQSGKTIVGLPAGSRFVTACELQGLSSPLRERSLCLAVLLATIR